MTWPPSAYPLSTDNVNDQVNFDTHPALHNDANASINDLVVRVNGLETVSHPDITANWTQGDADLGIIALNGQYAMRVNGGPIVVADFYQQVGLNQVNTSATVPAIITADFSGLRTEVCTQLGFGSTDLDFLTGAPIFWHGSLAGVDGVGMMITSTSAASFILLDMAGNQITDIILDDDFLVFSGQLWLEPD